jgi:hypothetical protein
MIFGAGLYCIGVCVLCFVAFAYFRHDWVWFWTGNRSLGERRDYWLHVAAGWGMIMVAVGMACCTAITLR